MSMKALARPDEAECACRGVHLQDITRLNDGKSDMRDGLVNWSKMRQIASFCAVVVKIVPPQPEEAVHRRVAELTADHPVYSDDVRRPFTPLQGAELTPCVFSCCMTYRIPTNPAKLAHLHMGQNCGSSWLKQY